MLDKEHYSLITNMDAVIALTKAGDTKSAHRKFISLKDELLVHFEHEEKYMEDIGYPYLQAHKQNHKDIIAKIDTIMQSFTHDKRVSDLSISMLEDLFVGHIDYQDMQYADYVARNASMPA